MRGNGTKPNQPNFPSKSDLLRIWNIPGERSPKIRFLFDLRQLMQHDHLEYPDSAEIYRVALAQICIAKV